MSEQATHPAPRRRTRAVRIVAAAIWLAIGISAVTDILRPDRSSNPPFSEVTAHLRVLPEATCTAAPSGGPAEFCTWGPWELTLWQGQGTVPEFCHGKHDQHVWLGFGDWHLFVAPSDQTSQLPALTNDEYAALQHTFDFGAGGAWQAR
jgi:hypothetical protein